MSIYRISVLMISLVCIAGLQAEIPVQRTSSTPVGLYEKFEAVYDLSAFSYTNPYNPHDIDVTAVFTSPGGRVWNVVGFYDDYQDAAEWKVRFSPNEIGEWTYVIHATDKDGSDQSAVKTFTAIESEHHGWVVPSAENPHYLEHDDGSGFFGVGMYTPWRNDVEKFDTLKRFGGNTFAIWNITYGGMTNGFGLIEEELGKYNQLKCGKLDELFEVAEERDLKIMYCFWPHDLFSATVWAHQWHQNPYRQICDVKDVYSDSLCWEYQTRQYRYLIARYAHSRSLGFWEMMNEINGTDGWAAGRHDDALEWVRKVHQYFKTHDPYQHPTTASRSGGYGEYWPEMYEEIDLPNLHVYETQGWPSQYAGDPLRSSSYNYAEASQRLWQRFDKPAIFGEAGADWVHVDVNSPEYTSLYHNAIWACLTNGLAAIPYWWTFTNPIDDAEREQMLYLSRFVEDINFVQQSREHYAMSTDAYDLYGMKNDSTAFGWVRRASGESISGMQLDLDGILNPAIPVYAIRYYSTWDGETLETRIRPHVDHVFRDTIPMLKGDYPDVAFKIAPAEGGESPALLKLSAPTYTTLNVDSMTVSATCYLFDEHNRFCPDASAPVTFALLGHGSLNEENVMAEYGVARVLYRPSNEPGDAMIVATSPDLAADTVTIRVEDKIVVDDFEGYRSDEALRSVWESQSGENASLSLDTEGMRNNSTGVRLDYAIGPDYKLSAVIEKAFRRSYAGGRFFKFWIKPDGSGRELNIRIYNQQRRYWTFRHILSGTDSTTLTIALEDLETRFSDVELDLADLAFMRITVRKGEGEYGTGTIYFDDFSFPEQAPTGIKGSTDDTIPRMFDLGQNYPNPFNMSTHIQYHIPEPSDVELSVYNVQGQVVEMLVNQRQEMGRHTVTWTAPDDLSSGVYVYKLKAGSFSAFKKCLLVK